jgi:hypothetical protein
MSHLTTSGNDQDQHQDHLQTTSHEHTALPTSSAPSQNTVPEQFFRDHDSRFTKHELSDMCRLEGLRVTGNKPVLIQRLWAHRQSNTAASNSQGLQQATLSSVFPQRRTREGYVDRDDDPDFRISRLEDDQDDADDPDATPPLAVRMVRSNLRARKILDMGKPERYQAEIHLHLTKCELFMQLVDRARKILQDVQGHDGQEFELQDPPPIPHYIHVNREIGSLQSIYTPRSQKDFFVLAPLFLIAVYFFYPTKPNPLFPLFTFPHVSFFAAKYFSMTKRQHTRGRHVEGGASYNMMRKLAMVFECPAS